VGYSSRPTQFYEMLALRNAVVFTDGSR